jgi:AmmeMemoRadiSam system protein A
MIPTELSTEDRLHLLRLARQAIHQAVKGHKIIPLNVEDQPGCLQEIGACFVTLTRNGELRGCIGGLEANNPLALDVQEHAVAAALQDYRFSSITQEELPEIKIEISRLTPPLLLEYQSPEDIVEKIRPGIDGVVLKSGTRRATFLPQVWKKVSEPEQFLSYLCHKLGEDQDAWRKKNLEVWVYQVEEFSEDNYISSQ